MAYIKEAESTILVEIAESEAISTEVPQAKIKKCWPRVIVYTIFVLIGQSGATLLARLYYKQGGNSILLAALLETIAFPLLIPFSLYFSTRYLNKNEPLTNDHPQPRPLVLISSSVYITLGMFQAAANVLYAIGLQNLPVSIFSLISTSQLGFNAFFSFFLNAQKITPLILNSLLLLTLSSALLIFHTNPKSPSENSKREQLGLGFSCTIVASALYSLTLSLTQLSFQKILKKETFGIVLDMIIYQSLVETIAVAVALFASGEWCGLRKEMESFELGKVTYLMVLVSIALAWQMCSIGGVGLIFEVSSLFSNAISTLGLPIMPILAVVFFHEKMDEFMVVSLILAVAGFGSYVYQNYLDDCKIVKGDGFIEVAAQPSSSEAHENSL